MLVPLVDHRFCFPVAVKPKIVVFSIFCVVRTLIGGRPKMGLLFKPGAFVSFDVISLLFQVKTFAALSVCVKQTAENKAAAI